MFQNIYSNPIVEQFRRVFALLLVLVLSVVCITLGAIILIVRLFGKDS